MAPQLPAFAYSVRSCDEQSRSTCTSKQSMDYVINERWHNQLKGAEEFTKTLLTEWDMNNKLQIAMCDKQIYIYAPPCVKALEVALSQSMSKGTVVNNIFAGEVEQGIACPSLPLKIRIDERLSSCGSGLEEYKSKMTELLAYLKGCATNQSSPPGLARLQLTSVQPGTWVANHFDIPYLEQRCYNASINATEESQKISMAKIAEAGARPNYNTGSLIIADKAPLESLVQASDRPEATAMHRADPDNLFKLTPSTESFWETSFFGQYKLIWPPTPWAESVKFSYNKKANPEDTLSWKDVITPDLKEKVKRVGMNTFKSIKKDFKRFT